MHLRDVTLLTRPASTQLSITYRWGDQHFRVHFKRFPVRARGNTVTEHSSLTYDTAHERTLVIYDLKLACILDIVVQQDCVRGLYEPITPASRETHLEGKTGILICLWDRPQPHRISMQPSIGDNASLTSAWHPPVSLHPELDQHCTKQ